MHDPSIIILVELKVSSSAARTLIGGSSLNQMLVAEAQGFAQGIWVLWDDKRIHIEQLVVHAQIITVVVMDNNSISWLLTASLCENLWECIM